MDESASAVDDVENIDLIDEQVYGTGAEMGCDTLIALLRKVMRVRMWIFCGAVGRLWVTSGMSPTRRSMISLYFVYVDALSH